MATYKQHTYLFMTLDPVHIGTGGYRLGRVDNSIVREPSTNVPKIPGTSLHGAARSYAAQLYETPEAAGQSQEGVENPDQNPICYTFGYIKKAESGGAEKTIAYSGVVNVFDARVLLFPVQSMEGPVWVSTENRLIETGFTILDKPTNWGTGSALSTWEREDALNLGWLMVNIAGQVNMTAPGEWRETPRWQTVQNRIVLVHDSLFSHVVNSNLEVRTSVAIDPERGAAEDKDLFTYEAMPRTTFLTADVVLDDYRSGKNGWELGEINQTDQKNPLPGRPWNGPLDVVTAGLKMIEWLGVGGMGTRGFGRMAVIGTPKERSYGKEA